MSKLAKTIGFFLAVALLGASPAAASLRIVAPVAVEASQPIPFAAAPSGPADEIAFYVDGRRRFVDHAPSWKFGRSGSVRLGVGHHVLKVRARQGNRVLTTTRGLQVEQASSEPVSASAETEIPVSPSPRRPHSPVTTPSPASPSPAPPPVGDPSPDPAPTAPGLLFDGARIADFRELQAAPQAISEVPDPLGSSERVLDMTVDEGDVYPLTPTENPRAQALSPEMIEDGDEFWLQTKFMLPQDFPYVPGWMSLVSIYGPPFGGSSPWQLGINESEFRWQRNGRHADDIPWRSPVVKGQWVTVLLHERFARDGWVEMWIDGQRISFFPQGNRNPSHEPETDHLTMETMDPSNDGGANSAKIMQYRMAGMFQSSSVYFGALKIGTTRASVES